VDDGYALLRAIEANPDEDTPRLAYADWLEESAASADRARAEFIRVQCELARTPPGDRRGTLAGREFGLLIKYREEWQTAYPIRFAPRYAYVRGFVFPHVKAADFVKYDEKLAAVTPLHNLRLSHTGRAVEGIAASRILRYVRNLTMVSGGLPKRHLSALLASQHLVNVRVLDLAGCDSLAATDALPALRILLLSGNPIKDRGFLTLAGGPWFANLIGFHVSNCGVSDGALVRLAGLPGVSQLRSLDAPDRDRGDAAARAILDSAYLSRLERLWYPDRTLSDSVRDALHARFGPKLNPTIYWLD
jgi:uncharacterized protein (TIGR02996 family)